MAKVFHFEADNPEHTARVADFREDLNRDVVGCIRRHITTGDPAGLSQATYYDLRQRVADQLELHPSAIVVVGSCRVGFTIKPTQRYRPFGPASDIDVAVVSELWFEKLWDAVFFATQPDRDWVLTNKQGKALGRDLFHGWLTPERLPSLPGMAESRRWTEWFAGLTRERICDRHSIRGRVYRDWMRLEQYQSHYVRLCRT